MLKLEWDEGNKVIRFGKSQWEYYRNYKNAKAWAYDVMQMNGIHLSAQGLSKQQWNKAVGDAFGCSYARLFKHFMALQFKAFIGEDAQILKKIDRWNFGKGWGGSSAYKLVKHRHALRQTYTDGLYNLLPLVASTGKTPQELREAFKAEGKMHKWKVLTKNSLHNNKALCKAVSDSKHLIKYAVDTPTTLVKRLGICTQDVSDYLKNNFKGEWKNHRKMYGEIQVFQDTQQMAENLNQPFNPTWSARRMHEEHERLTRLTHKEKYSDEPIKALENVSVLSVEHEGYVATLLKSALAIAEEGSAMSHCVGSYAYAVKEGNYLVYSVTKNGERSSTVGITLYDGKPQLQQQYGRFNAQVTDEHEKQIAALVVEKLCECLEEVNANKD